MESVRGNLHLYIKKDNVRLTTAAEPSHGAHLAFRRVLARPDETRPLPLRLAKATVILGRLDLCAGTTTNRRIAMADGASPCPFLGSRVVYPEVSNVACAAIDTDVEVSVRTADLLAPLLGRFFWRQQRVVVHQIHVDRLPAKGLDEDLAPDLQRQPREERALRSGAMGRCDEALMRRRWRETSSALRRQLRGRRNRRGLQQPRRQRQYAMLLVASCHASAPEPADDGIWHLAFGRVWLI